MDDARIAICVYFAFICWTLVGQGSCQVTQNTDYRTHKSTLSSLTLKSDSLPVFYMEQIAGTETGFKAKVASFEYLNKFLEVAGESKLSEIQEMLQVCREPISQIFGVSGESGKALLESFDSFNNESDTRKKEQYAKLYKLLLVINSFDLQLMSNAVRQGTSKDKYLDIAKVTEELEMLKSFCGAEATNALVKIDWDSGTVFGPDVDFTFSNGFKAPPWRQIYGELSYVQVQCQDKDAFIVTASKKGYFINKGYTSDASGNEHLNYEAVSENFGTLVELLRANSAHFAAHIDLQGYTYHRPTKEAGLTAIAAEDDTAESPCGTDVKADRVEDSYRRIEKDTTKRPKDGKKKYNLF